MDIPVCQNIPLNFNIKTYKKNPNNSTRNSFWFAGQIERQTVCVLVFHSPKRMKDKKKWSVHNSDV